METDVLKNAKSAKVNFYEIFEQDKLRQFINIKLQENVKNATVIFMIQLSTLVKIYLNMNSTDHLKKLTKLIFAWLWEAA